MIGIMLQWFGGYSFTDLLNEFEALGFFKYVLPFLLIFAVVYAILTKIPVFKDNKGASVIAALAVGFLALQWDVVPVFFETIFPNLGVGLSILLAALILAGAFISDEQKAFKWIFFGIGMFIFVVIVFSSLSSYQFTGNWYWTGWWGNYGGLIVFLLILAGVVLAVVLSGRHDGGTGGH